MRREGVEPSCLATLASETSASAIPPPPRKSTSSIAYLDNSVKLISNITSSAAAGPACRSTSARPHSRCGRQGPRLGRHPLAASFIKELRLGFFTAIILFLKGETMFLDSFKITLSGVGQIFLLGAIGYFLFKRNILSSEGLDSLNRIVIDVTLPIMIFCQLVKDFSFRVYANWWLFPILSILITLAGLAIGYIFSRTVKGEQHRLQFIGLVAFQNSGYLPLALIGSLLSALDLGVMFIYLFLFLAGFNLLMFSLGAELICYHKLRKFEIMNLFSAPVVATIIGLITVYLGLNRFIPEVVLKPLRLVGDCTLPLAMFVVGANLAEIKLTQINKKEMALALLAKLVVLPALGLLLVLKLKFSALVGLLIVMQLAMPPATLLSVLTRHYKKEDLLISQGIFLSHLASIITIPVFLSLYLYLKTLP